MEDKQYEVCLHHLTASRCTAAWNNHPVRLEVYADGAPQDHLTKYNGGCDTWDLSDTCYRFTNHIGFRLIAVDGSEHGQVLATFQAPGSPTETYGAHAHDEEAGYELGYTVYAVERVVEPVVQWATTRV